MEREELDKELFAIASEIEALLLSGGVLGVCAIVVTADGNVSQRLRYIKDGKFPLLAGVTLAHHSLVELIKEQP